MTNHKEIQWARFKEIIRGNTHDEILFNKSDETNNTRYAVQERDKEYIVIGSIPNDVNSIPSVKIPIKIFNECGYIDNKEDKND